VPAAAPPAAAKVPAPTSIAAPLLPSEEDAAAFGVFAVAGNEAFWKFDTAAAGGRGHSSIFLGAFARNLLGFRWRLLRLLDDRVQHDDPLAFGDHVGGASDAVLALHAHLPQLAFEVLDSDRPIRG
jgi:hypothetical protein